MITINWRDSMRHYFDEADKAWEKASMNPGILNLAAKPKPKPKPKTKPKGGY